MSLKLFKAENKYSVERGRKVDKKRKNLAPRWWKTEITELKMWYQSFWKIVYNSFFSCISQGSDKIRMRNFINALLKAIFRSEMFILPASRKFNYFILPTLQYLCLCVNIFNFRNYNNYWSQFIETIFSIVLLPTGLSDNVFNLLAKEKVRMLLVNNFYTAAIHKKN